ncbi:hypothetical protein QBC43DRAFT_311938 [Cladorrhinum sp. PSN259]|nr:hypothetical protein QBC43DRAFT_311938 [Cladorrhinum sp. PSN259]
MTSSSDARIHGLCLNHRLKTQGTTPRLLPESNLAAATPRYCFDQSYGTTLLRTHSQDSSFRADDYLIRPKSESDEEALEEHHSDHEYEFLHVKHDDNTTGEEHWTTVVCSSSNSSSSPMEPDSLDALDVVLHSCLVLEEDDDDENQAPAAGTAATTRGHLKCPLLLLRNAAKPNDAAHRPECVNRAFHDFAALKQHMKDHHHRPDHYCPRCGDTSFADIADWKSHIIARECVTKPMELLDSMIPGLPGDTMDYIMRWEPDSSLSDEKNWEHLMAVLDRAS